MKFKHLALTTALALALAAGPVAAQSGPSAISGAVEEFAAMRDGVKLAANVFKPAGKGPWPVIISRTPYLKDGPKDRENAPAQLASQAKRYTDAGYVFVVQDTRGKGRSEGAYLAFENDIEDGYDTLEWIAAQPWSNGKVGITGGSALGITGNAAAMAAHPALKAAYVVVAPSDLGEYRAPGGVPKEKDTSGWLKEQGVEDKVIEASRARIGDDVFWNRGSMSAKRKYIRIPMFNVGGWYDIFSEGATGNFAWLQNHGAKGARGNQKVLMGPFGHGELSGDLAYPGYEQALKSAGDQELRWFDHWLKGAPNGIMDEPPVSYFMMASARKGAPSPKNRMMTSANWPPAHREIRYYLTADNGLSPAPPTAEASKTTYRFDPAKPVETVGGANLTFDRGPMDQRAIPARQDYLRFQTPVLDKDVVIAGPVKVELNAATDGPDTDFMAKLVDVYPDGYEAIVLDAPVRARFRKGRMADDLKPMTPNAPEELVIDLWGTAITFEKGHRIALHITSSNSPRFEVNPNTGEAPKGARLKPRVAVNSVYHDAAHPSALVLPVIYPQD
ncbi:MAG: CocE/NonD family hydrolase [Pseudomonadota bacterium]